MEEAIASIKKALTSKPLLAHPNFDLPFEIHCDASPSAIGAVLVQKVGSVEKVIMYISRALRDAEEKYHQYEREALALVWASKVFRPYVIGSKFKVVTDCKALVYMGTRPSNARIIKWVMELEEYDISYVHRAGSKHLNADALTRGIAMPAGTSFARNDTVPLLHLQPHDWDEDPTLPGAYTRAKSQKVWTTSQMKCLSCCKKDICTECLSRCKDDNHICVCTALPPVPSPECGMAQGEEWVLAAHELLQRVTVPPTMEVDLSLPSLDAIREAQVQDKGLAKIRSYVNSCTAEQLNLRAKGKQEGFFLLNGVLMTNNRVPGRFRKRSRERFTLQQICVPHSMRTRAVLYSVHGLPLAGHDGVLRTTLRLRQDFWWKSFAQDVKKWVRSCHCQRRKTPRPLRHGLTKGLMAPHPWHTLSYDIVGPLPVTETGCQYLLAAFDHHSRYPFAMPIPNKSSVVVARALHRNVFCIFGPPK